MKINHKKDKELLTNLSDFLNISKTHIRKDELNYWCIIGKETWIDTDGEFWYFHILNSTARKWNNCKKALPEMEVAIDGDDEGVLRMRDWPDDKQAKIIRKLLGFRQSYIPASFSKIAPATTGFPAPILI